MNGRTLWLDRSPGEVRGVVVLDGEPERLLIQREDEPDRARLGEVRRGRVRALAKGFRGAFIDLGLEQDGLLKLSADAPALTEGQAVEAEVAAEARADKAPSLRLRGLASGPPALLTPAPSLEERLRALAPDTTITTGEEAREAADEAEEAALAVRFALPRGLVMTVEPTRALIAVDVDLTEPGASRKTVLDANRAAIREAARLLRLKGLAGLVAIDLAGEAREHDALHAVAKDAFSPDQPGVVLAGISRLGLLQLAKPWRERPVRDVLTDPDGRLSARTVAARLLRALEREGRADPGARLTGVCAPEVAEHACRHVAALGPRFSITPELGRDRLSTDIRSR
ncbi:MAG TPA: ribonuclease E/G [Caulobacteraceae bacterium]|nr:ribonuclease E/G [Caulobacteraceae bacterium]